MPAQAPHDPNCIFCKIASGHIPCYKLYEDERVLAFLDIEPLSKGHTLVIPKAHYARLEEMPADAAAGAMVAIPRIAAAVVAVVGAQGWNLLQNNGQVASQSVPHVHLHIIPRWEGDGLGYRWQPKAIDKATVSPLLAAIAAKIR